MQDKIILGLLLEGDKSSYELIKYMKQSTGFFYNTSQGSVQPALKKLLASGFIEFTEKINGKRRSIVYHITKTGEQEFFKWVNEDIPITKPKEPALVKMFFFNYSDKDSIKSILQKYINEIKSTVNYLKELEAFNLRIINEKKLTINEKSRFRMDSLQFGMDYYLFLLKWYQNYLELIEKR